MIISIFSIILFLLFSCFPIVLWSYGVTLLSHHEWNRSRFFYGMLGGGLSVIVLSLLRTSLNGSILIQSLAMISVLACLLLFVVLMSAHGSAYVKVFLRKTALLHAGLFLILYILLESGIFFLLPRGMNLLPLVGSISGFLFAAAIEESTKHLSSVGLTAKEFRFSRKDLLIFIFFISLGFVCIENLLYLVRAFPLGIYPLIVTGVSRSLFGLLAHLFSASICVMFWWKALSYGVFSLKYILIFLTGFILASISHITFNLLVSIAPLWSVLVYAFIAYFAFTQWLILDES